MILFPEGVKGLSDSIWQGVKGSAKRLVGIDYRSEPGLIKVQQALAKDSGTTVDEFCKVGLPVSDGSNLWFSSTSGKIWREIAGVYTLVTTLEINAFDLRTTIDPSKSYDYSAEVNLATATIFKPDGLTMYVMCNALTSGNSGEIFQYTLTTAFDISTASYASKTFAADLQGTGMFISPDGTRLFVSEDNGATTVISYTMGTAWDISTAVADAKTFDFSTQTNRGYCVSFDPTGTKMYVWGQDDTSIHQYTLSTAWDVTTASFTASFDTTLAFSYGGYMNTDGTKFFISGSDSLGTVYEFSMSTAFDVTSATQTNSYNQGSSRTFGLGFAPDGSSFYVGVQSNPETVYQYDLAVEDLSVNVLGAKEFGVADGVDSAIVNYIYFATENWLFRIAVSDIASTWIDDYDYITLFFYSDDTYHPFSKQNNRLYIGDKYVLLEVNEAGVVTLQSNFNVQAPERITTITDFDTDLLVGTKDVASAWVKRWDTESDSWYAQDEVFETEIYAFIRDDNYVYVQAGDFGRMYFYDGEKLHPDTSIPGSYSPTNRCKVNANAVANLLGIPLFGVSNIEGNSTWQGIYGYGRYSKNYNTTLDLSFPLSTNLFDDTEIGAVIVQGADMYVSWKTLRTFGIDKIDWNVKYDSAFIESTMLVDAKTRSLFKAIKEMSAEYFKLPTDTSVEFSIENNYKGFDDIEVQQKVDIKKNQVFATATKREIGAPRVMIEFNVNGNDGPEIENFNVKFEGEK